MGPFAWRSPFPEALRGKETVTNRLSSSRMSTFLIGVVALASVRIAVAAPELEFDHVWIVVSRDAPERAALERAGFKISPNINRNDGQGTASVSAEFLNVYIELMWPDPTGVGCAWRRTRRREIQEQDELAHQRLVSDRHRASSRWPNHDVAVSNMVDRA